MYFNIWTSQGYERSLLSTYFYHYVQEGYKLRITLLFTDVYRRVIIYILAGSSKNCPCTKLDGTSISLRSRWKFPSTSRFVYILCYSEIFTMWAPYFTMQYYIVMPPMRDSIWWKVMGFLKFQVFCRMGEWPRETSSQFFAYISVLGHDHTS